MLLTDCEVRYVNDLKTLLLKGEAKNENYEEAIVRLYAALKKCNKKQAALRYWKFLREEEKKSKKQQE